MPFGMISHNLSFFAADDVSNLSAPEDYKSWCQSMYTLFGNKWAAMQCGPMWSYEQTKETKTPTDIVSVALKQTFGSTDLINCCDATSTYINSTSDEHTDAITTHSSDQHTDAITTHTSDEHTDTITTHSSDQHTDTITTHSSDQHTDAITTHTSDEHTHAITTHTSDQHTDAITTHSSDQHTHAITTHSSGHTSTLWSTLSDCERREQEGSNLSAQDLEQMFDVRPRGQASRKLKRDPLKVGCILVLPVIIRIFY
jgi:hypothetical protein